MVEMVEAVTVAHGVVILDVQVEVIQEVPEEVMLAGLVDAVIQEDLLLVILAALPVAIIVEGVHRIVRVVLVHPVVDLQPCPKNR